MKLRPRLALATAALLLPVAALFVWVEAQLRERAGSDVLVERAKAMLDDDARARCEESPEQWVRSIQRRSGPPPGPHAGPPPDDLRPPPSAPPPNADATPPVHLFPFDADLRATVAWGPRLDPELAAAARGGASEARRRVRDERRSNDEALLRTPWGTGPCAFVLAVRPSVVTAERPIVLLRTWAAPLVALVAAIVLALGPIVARIRQLGAKVRGSAQHRYADPIEMRGDDEIAELAAAFDGAAREVRAHIDAQERREQTLRDFLANTTHDVMTPLTVLQGHLASLRQAASDGTPVDRVAVDAAIREASYMAALVHNLGVAARLEAGEPHFVRSPVDVGRLVERCVDRHRPIARQNDVEIECAVPERAIALSGDETFLEQAISNVVFNAIRHNRAGGHVAVVVSELDGDRFRVRVVDDGPGMPDDDLARLNASDQNDPSRTRRRDGHGLGLAITRRVARLHGLTLAFARSEAGGVQVDLEGSTARSSASAMLRAP